MEIVSLSGTFSVVESDENYFYIGGDSGVVFIRKSDSQEVAYATVESGVNAIWIGDSGFVYLGTGVSGVYRLPKYEYITSGSDISSELVPYLSSPDILDDTVLAIDALHQSYMAIGTVSGINVISGSINYSSSFLINVRAIKVSDVGEI